MYRARGARSRPRIAACLRIPEPYLNNKNYLSICIQRPGSSFLPDKASVLQKMDDIANDGFLQ